MKITSNWNPNRGKETKVTFHDEWKNMHYVEKLDHLLDTIGELEDCYNEIRANKESDD